MSESFDNQAQEEQLVKEASEPKPTVRASRLAYSLRNVGAAWIGLAFFMLTNMITRAVFARTLGQDYLGVQGLFTAVLTILSLAELGVGSAITFALYEPLGKGEQRKVQALMQLFKRAYTTIGVVVIAIGAILTPFVHLTIKAIPPALSLGELRLYFFMFVLNTGLSYFFSYKAALITANQREYQVSFVTYLAMGAMCLIQAAVIILTHNYIAFLCVMLVFTFLQNLIIARLADASYPFLKERLDEPISQVVGAKTLSEIKKNILALVLHRIGGIATRPLISIFISNFVGLASAGLYANYLLVESAIENIFDKLFNAIIASVGNLVVLEGGERTYQVFKTSFFINALCYSVAAGGFLSAANAFIPIWVGSEYLFPYSNVFFIGLGIYAYGMRSAVLSFTSAYGLYWHTRYKPLVEFALFIAMGIPLIKLYGINGILFTGAIIKLTISTGIESWALFKYGLKQNFFEYVRAYLRYFLATVVLVAACLYLCHLLALSGVAAFLVYSLLGALIPSLGFILIFWCDPACEHARSILMRVGRALITRIVR